MLRCTMQRCVFNAQHSATQPASVQFLTHNANWQNLQAPERCCLQPVKDQLPCRSSSPSQPGIKGQVCAGHTGKRFPKACGPASHKP